ncbi:hypothetical protein F4777DRAFT_577012 [Nemania sp. FL0916]|nr:hypothetical protein F4777DRAFT_577012 [Nemania sp. FL0916]
MLLLTDLPPEIVHHILGYVNPPDLASVPRTCRSLYHAVTGNTTVFKQVYLHHLDTPTQSPVEWERFVKDVVRLQAVCGRSKVDDKKDELDFVHRIVTELLRNASTEGIRPGLAAKLPESRNVDILEAIFHSESNRSAFLCRSFIYERARAEFHSHDVRYWHGPPKPEHQKSAHLHCLYGVPSLYAYPSSRRQSRHSLMHPFACSKVYDLRQYTQKNQWGPFLDDGTMRVDWEKVEAVMIVLGASMKNLGVSRIHMCEAFCSIPFAGTWPNSWKSPHGPSPPRELEALEHEDPYGITGVWLRVVCFLDYTDLFAYNFGAGEQPPPHVPRPAINVGQATRLILMRIFVTSVEDPGPEDGQALKVVHFKGVSRSFDHGFNDNADSDIRGSVRLTPEGEVRWTTFSIFGGVERWRSESIQVGGVKSAKGVVGHWFDRDFDPQGPAGPTAFWKISDNKGSSQGEGSNGDDILAEMAEAEGDDDEYEEYMEEEVEDDSDEIEYNYLI